MQDKTIKITCKGQKYISIDKLKNFQGNLKELRKDELGKLQRSILKHGFSFPVFVWKNNMLDGHQRIFATKELLKEGYTISDIPIVEIMASDRSEAAEKLLFLNSRYAKITDDGLYEFLNDFDLDLNDMAGDLEFPDIDFDRFMKGYVEDVDKISQIKDELKHGLLITVGFCDILILPTSEYYNKLFSFSGKYRNFTEEEKINILKAVVNGIK